MDKTAKTSFRFSIKVDLRRFKFKVKFKREKRGPKPRK